MYIRNNYKTGIGLLKGYAVQPGECRRINNIDEHLANQMIARWVKTGILTVLTDEEYAEQYGTQVEEVEAAPDLPDPEPEPDEQDKLLVELAELGIKRDRRTGVEKLQALIADARAKQDAGTTGEQDAEQ